MFFLVLQVLHFGVKTALFLFSFMTHFTFSSCLIRYQFWRNLEWPDASFILMHFAAACHQLKPKPAQVWRAGRHFAFLGPLFLTKLKNALIFPKISHLFCFIEINLIQSNGTSWSPNPLKFEELADILHLSGQSLKEKIDFLDFMKFISFNLN